MSHEPETPSTAAASSLLRIRYNDQLTRQFVAASIVWGIVGMLVGLLAAPQVMKAWRYDPKAPENAIYYTTSLETKLTYGLFYIGLAAFTAIRSSKQKSCRPPRFTDGVSGAV